jgi:predicted SprT family Zn-dependent metalloprotease
MKQLFLELVNWISPRQMGPIQPESPPSKPRLKSLPSSKNRTEIGLPTEAALEEISRDLLNRLGCHELAKRVCVRWNSRLQSTAGRAHYMDSQVVLNPRLVEFGSDEIDRTLRHELAHLVARFRAGRHKIGPHGNEWKQACCDLGLFDEKRTHNLALPRRVVQRKHSYRCPNCSVEIARVKPFRSKVACLPCCRKFGKGRYDARFRLVKEKQP